LLTLAQQRLQAYANNLYLGNVWNWVPQQRFDYVRTELDYVPSNYRQLLIERLLAKFVVPNGQLIIAQYRSRRDDLTDGWVDRELDQYGFQVVERHSGYSGEGLELCRVAVLRP
jgi:hypothetical protein